MTSTDTLSSIHDNDVLCGRGGATNNHVGNKRFRSIVQRYQGEYLEAKKKDKGVISKRIVKLIHERGGRFLKKGPNGVWVPVTEKKATEKTSQALRENLDVKHKEFRTKVKRETDYGEEESPRKRARCVEGKVDPAAAAADMTSSSPALVSESGYPNAIPDMNPDQMPLPFVFYQPAMISTDDCDHVESV